MQQYLKVFDGDNPLRHGCEERPNLAVMDRVLYRRWNHVSDVDLIFVMKGRVYFYHPDLRRVPREQIQSIRLRLFRLEMICIKLEEVAELVVSQKHMLDRLSRSFKHEDGTRQMGVL